MRYRTLSDGAQLSSDVAAFVNLLGQVEYIELLGKIGAGLNHKGYVTETDDVRFSLELQLLNLELLRLQGNGALHGMPAPLHEAADFALGVGQTIRHLSEKARRVLRSRLLGGLKTDGLRPVQHEFRVAGSLSHLGYNVTFADLEGGTGGFDFLAERDGKAFEIEGKWAPVFLGQAILPQDAEKLFLALKQTFNGWTDEGSIPILSVNLCNRLNVNHSAISSLIEACNIAARTRATAVLEDYATVKFLGAIPEASGDRLSDTMQIDRMSTLANVFLSITRPRVALRLDSARPSKFVPKILATLSDSAKQQFSRSRPAVIWLHIDYISPALFDSLANAEKAPSFFDLLALAFLDSPSRPHISQLIVSGGGHLARQGENAFSSFRRVVYNAPRCQFGAMRLFPDGKNFRASEIWTGQKAKSMLARAKIKFNILSGSKEISTAMMFSFLNRLSASRESVGRFAACLALFSEALKLGEQGRSAEAFQIYDQLLGLFADANEDIFQETIAAALYNRGNMLLELGKHADALLAYQTVVSRLGASDTPLIAEKFAFALYNSAQILARSPTRVAEAIGMYARLIELIRTCPRLYPQDVVAKSLVNMGSLLGFSESALSVYDEVLNHFSNSSEAGLREQVKKALLNKGQVLMRIGRAAEALDTFDAVLAHPGTSQARSKQWAIFWKMRALSSLGRESEVPDLCDKLVESIDPTTALRLRKAGAAALLMKASALKAGGDRIGEVAACEALVSRFGRDADHELVTLVIAAQQSKVEALASYGRYSEAALACDDIVARCDGKDAPPEPSEHVAWALFAKASFVAREGRSEDAAKACSEIIGRFGPGSPPPLLELASRALAERAAHFCDLGRYQKALADCDAFLAAYEASANPQISGAVALALLAKGLSLLKMERKLDATVILNGIVNRFGDVAELPFSDYVASARELLRVAEGG